MIVSKKKFTEAIPKFIKLHNRLPYMKEDDIIVSVDVEVKDKDGNVENKTEERPYTATKYIKGHFGDVDSLSNYLFDNNIISFKIISDMIGVTPKRIEELISGKAKKVEKNERRAVHLFFGKDYYEDIGKYNETHCEDCTKKKSCGQDYWVSVISCDKFTKSKAKKKK